MLPSITNEMLQRIAQDQLGLTVVKRSIDLRKDVQHFDEVAAVGTAVIVTPIESVTIEDEGMKEIKILPSDSSSEDYPTFTALYDAVRGIQTGDAPDPYGWRRVVKGV